VKRYYLAVDIGASSGRLILGSLHNGCIEIEEIHRFENIPVSRNDTLCWQLDKLFVEIISGLKKCAATGKIPISMGIDTWGVDFVLLGDDGQMIGEPVAYRDRRTQGLDIEIDKLISPESLYSRTGTQKQIFNSIYQLYAIKKNSAELMQKADRFLMVPEYLNYLLTGTKMSEYTNATTTGLVNAHAQTWDRELLDLLGFPLAIFGQLQTPGTLVGSFSAEVAREVGFYCDVVLPATHDTASAVLAAPIQDDQSIYISSGTWSLIGTELEVPNCTEESRRLNFTNEGGYDYRYRYLKNIMGLWMIQSLKKELGDPYSFSEINRLARNSQGFSSIVEVNDPGFLSPDSMTLAIKDFCVKSNQAEPKTPGETAECIYQSLAKSYAATLQQIEHMTNQSYSTIHIIGGGSRDAYLNELTIQATDKRVLSGPVEATTIGNILAQMIRAGEFNSVEEARKLVASSFLIKEIRG
jgi:rhamnulokinase